MGSCVEVIEEFSANCLGLFDLSSCNDNYARVRVSVNIEQVVSPFKAKRFPFDSSSELGKVNRVLELSLEFLELVDW